MDSSGFFKGFGQHRSVVNEYGLVHRLKNKRLIATFIVLYVYT